MRASSWPKVPTASARIAVRRSPPSGLKRCPTRPAAWPARPTGKRPTLGSALALAGYRRWAAQLPAQPARPDARGQRTKADQRRTDGVGERKAGIPQRQAGEAEEIERRQDQAHPAQAAAENVLIESGAPRPVRANARKDEKAALHPVDHPGPDRGRMADRG